MIEVFDYTQAILWSLTYVLIIYNAIRYRKEYPVLMPFLAGSLNFAWELNAVIISGGNWIHILWLVLDVIIFVLNLRNLKSPPLEDYRIHHPYRRFVYRTVVYIQA